MKVLVIGKGGREHALVWKLAQSQRVERVYCAPGNAGTAQRRRQRAARRQRLRPARRLRQEGGRRPDRRRPRGAAGRRASSITSTSTSCASSARRKAAAQIEASKVFAKALMRLADVPTADFVVFDHPDPARNYVRSREYVILPDGRHVELPVRRACSVVVEDGVKYLARRHGRRVKVSPPEPLVVKADGLAAGKGVFVCYDDGGGPGGHRAHHGARGVRPRRRAGRSSSRSGWRARS